MRTIQAKADHSGRISGIRSVYGSYESHRIQPWRLLSGQTAHERVREHADGIFTASCPQTGQDDRGQRGVS